MNCERFALLLGSMAIMLGCADLNSSETAETTKQDAIGTAEQDLYVNNSWLWQVGDKRTADVCFASGGGAIKSGLSTTKCLNVSGGNRADGTKIQLWDCNGSGAQNWSIPSEDKTLRALGKCLGVVSGGTASGTPVVLWTCDGTGSQQWDLVKINGQPRLKNPQSDKCLDVRGGHTDNGTEVRIYDCFDPSGSINNAQVWQLPNRTADGPTRRMMRDAIVNAWGSVAPLTLRNWGTCTNTVVPGAINVVIQDRRGDWFFTGGDDKGRRIIVADSAAGETSIRGGMVHEFGHVLGLNHEQARPENQYSAYCNSFNAGGTWATENKSPGDPVYGAYDPGSTMNYCDARYQAMLSRNDIEGIQKYYGTRGFRRSIWASNTWKQTTFSGEDNLLGHGTSWNSIDGKVGLWMDEDGQLRVKRNDIPGFGSLWASGTAVGSPAGWFSSEGILEVYEVVGTGVGFSRWKSTSASYPNASLTIHNNGDVIITDASGTKRWSTGTAHRLDLEGGVGLGPLESLYADSSMETASGNFQLRMQSDGNFVVYDKRGGYTPIWASNTNGSSARIAQMMRDGTLALLDYSGNRVWTAPFTGKAGAYLALQEDGNLVVYEQDKYQVWTAGGSAGDGATGSYLPTSADLPAMLWNGETLGIGEARYSASGRALLYMQTDGNLVLYVYGSSGWVATWSSRTWNKGGDHATLTTDGALQVHSASDAVLYDSGTSNHRNSYLTFDDNGTISIYRLVTTGTESRGIKGLNH